MGTIGERMKKFEKCSSNQLSNNMPIIIRIDGRAFHTFTQELEKPFDENFIAMMDAVGLGLCEEINGTRLAYLQSDEISMILYNEIGQESWFDNKLEKITSVSASIASALAMKWKYENGCKSEYIISFDSRAFVIPPHEVINYFIWRQKDWERNSLNMLARKYYPHKELNNKKKVELHDLIYQAGDNWANLPTPLKRGRCIIKKEITKYVENPYFKGDITRLKWVLDDEIPVFSTDKDYVLRNIPFISY